MEKILKIDKYISESDKSTKEFFDWVDSLGNEHALLNAPTESGKTTAIRKYMKERKSLKIALLAPTRALVDNLRDDKNDIVGYGTQFIVENWGEKQILTTYDSIEVLKDLDVVFVDEAHLMSSHSSFRTVVQNIMTLRCKVVFMSGTPEIIEHIKQKTLIIEQKHPIKRSVTIVDSKDFNRYAYAQNIIDEAIATKNRKGSLDETIMIRINSKQRINRLFELNKDKINIAFFYSDKESILYANQDKETIDNIKKGKIRGVDVLLVTSIIDAGLSLDVDRDLKAYAISNKNDLLPNPIDMLQLLARVRQSSGFKMDLTIAGNSGMLMMDEINSDFDSSNPLQMLEEMNDAYNQHRRLLITDYMDLLGYYNVEVKRLVGDSKTKENKKVKYLKRMRNIDLIKYLKVIDYKRFYKLEDEASANGYSFDHLKSLQIIDIATRGEGTPLFESVVDMIQSSIQYKIPTSFYITPSKVNTDRIEGLISLMDIYKKGTNDDFNDLIDSLISGVLTDGAKLDVSSYHTLIQSQKKLIRIFASMIFKRINWRYDKTKLKHISEDNTTSIRQFIYDSKLFNSSERYKPHYKTVKVEVEENQMKLDI